LQDTTAASNVLSSPCLRHHDTAAHGVVEVEPHIFLASRRDAGEWRGSRRYCPFFSARLCEVGWSFIWTEVRVATKLSDWSKPSLQVLTKDI
jgi:hypothetical protein